MNKKIVSALLCGTMVLATATPALAGEADGQKIALVGKSAGNAFFEIAAAKLRWFILKLLQQTRRSKFLTT